jgi:hypothetical protein
MLSISNTVRSACSSEFRDRFSLYFAGQEDDGCMPAVLLKELHRLSLPLFGGRVFS